MLDAVKDPHALSREAYDARALPLRDKVLQLQRALREADFPVMIVLEGFDGGGRSESMNLLHEWLDARDVLGEAFEDPTPDEAARPEYWRYWMTTPRRGRIAITMGGRYATAIDDALKSKRGRARLGRAMEHANRFERALTDDGALVIKLWFHLTRKQQKKRLAKLAASRRSAWRITKRMRRHAKHYGAVRKIAEVLLRETSSEAAPWHVIPGNDERNRTLAVMEIFAARLQAHLQARAKRGPKGAPEPKGSDVQTILDRVDMSLAVDAQTYERELPRLQGRLNRLAGDAMDAGVSVVAAFEGWDAAGKGGAIRRVLAALDARRYQVVRIGAPTEEERAHHYLWRFWRQLPLRGRMALFDRSWYGRVLVERVEGFATEPQWRRAYAEINEFEAQLAEHGVALAKFWLHIGQEEQLRRFEERQRIRYKQHKITDEDWRNRDKATQYEAAAQEMLWRTATPRAPWTVVAANDKRFARLAVLQTLCDRLEAALR